MDINTLALILYSLGSLCFLAGSLVQLVLG